MRHSLLPVISGLILLSASRFAVAQDAFITASSAIGNVSGDAYIGIDNYPGSQTVNTSPTVTLDNQGSVSGGVLGYNSSVVTITGGTAGNLTAYESSAFDVSGGTFTFVFGADQSMVSLHSGTTVTASIYAYDGSAIAIDGGSIGGSLFASDNSTLDLYGTGLSGSVVSLDSGGYSIYQLSGSLNDQMSVGGLLIYVAVDQYGNQATVNLINAGTTTTLTSVPESGAGALLAALSASWLGWLRAGNRRTTSQPVRSGVRS